MHAQWVGTSHRRLPALTRLQDLLRKDPRQEKTLSVRNRTLTLIVLVIAAQTLSLYFTSIALLGSIADYEKQSTQKSIELARHNLLGGLATLDALTFERAMGDTTGISVGANVTKRTFADMRLNLILFVHPSGQTIFGKAFDLQKEEEMPVPQSLQDRFSTEEILVRHSYPGSSITGIILLPEGPMLVTSRPVLSDDKGSIVGTLIAGRYLDAAAIERLATETHLSLALRRLDDPQMPLDFMEALTSLSAESPVVIQPLSAQTIVGYTLLNNIYGQPSLVLRITVPRDVYRRTQVGLRFFAFSLLAVDLLLGLLLLLLFVRKLQRMNAQLLEAVKARDEMIQNVSHELRTPLTHIMGYSEFLTDQTLSGEMKPEQLQAVGVIRDRAQALSRLVNTLLSLQALTPERLAWEEVDLGRLMNYTAAIWQERVQTAQVSLDVQVAPGLPAVRGDFYRLQEALDQIVDNALKFIEEKGKISLRAEPHHHEVWLSISDTGIGIPREKLEVIFERFYQVDGSRTRRHGGTGIGLALVRKIVSLHGGRIWAESDGVAGHGTTFRIALPATANHKSLADL